MYVPNFLELCFWASVIAARKTDPALSRVKAIVQLFSAQWGGGPKTPRQKPYGLIRPVAIRPPCQARICGHFARVRMIFIHYITLFGKKQEISTRKHKNNFVNLRIMTVFPEQTYPQSIRPKPGTPGSRQAPGRPSGTAPKPGRPHRRGNASEPHRLGGIFSATPHSRRFSAKNPLFRSEKGASAGGFCERTRGRGY